MKLAIMALLMMVGCSGNLSTTNNCSAPSIGEAWDIEEQCGPDAYSVWCQGYDTACRVAGISGQTEIPPTLACTLENASALFAACGFPN